MKQLPLARKENVLGHHAWRNACEHIPARYVAQFFLRSSSQLSIFGFHGFYNISFPKDRCEVIMTDENDVVTCDNLMQILLHKF